MSTKRARASKASPFVCAKSDPKYILVCYNLVPNYAFVSENCLAVMKNDFENHILTADVEINCSARPITDGICHNAGERSPVISCHVANGEHTSIIAELHTEPCSDLRAAITPRECERCAMGRAGERGAVIKLHQICLAGRQGHFCDWFCRTNRLFSVFLGNSTCYYMLKYATLVASSEPTRSSIPQWTSSIGAHSIMDNIQCVKSIFMT